jgi:hypothetical protein
MDKKRRKQEGNYESANESAQIEGGINTHGGRLHGSTGYQDLDP